MTYKVWLLIACLFISVTTIAQSEDLMVQGVTPDLYLLHTVKPKESLYNMGRMYNMPAKDIAAYNKLALEKPISIGQQIKIPLTAINFSQNNTKSADEVLVPVFHVVGEREWLFRISANYNKVSLVNLQNWNSIANEGLKAGMKLTIGYLKVKQGLSALALKGTADPRPTSPEMVTPPSTAAKKEVVTPPVEKVDTKPVVTDKPAEVPSAAVTPPPVLAVEKEKKEAAVEPMKPIETSNDAGLDFKGGYFKSQFTQAKKSSNGAAGIFKSVSGWNDGKYYALMNNVPAGTIVKIIAFASGKSIYAKVLGALPEMRESIGLTLRVSDAAANELGASRNRFNVEVKY